MINITWNILDRLCHTCILFCKPCMEVLCLVTLVTPLLQSIHLRIMQSSFWQDSIAERDSIADENYKLCLNTKNITFYTYLVVWHRISVNATCKSFLVNNHRHWEDWLNYWYFDLLKKNFRWLLASVFIFLDNFPDIMWEHTFNTHIPQNKNNPLCS